MPKPFPRQLTRRLPFPTAVLQNREPDEEEDTSKEHTEEDDDD